MFTIVTYSRARRYTIPAILMHRQSLRRIARISMPGYRESERKGNRFGLFPPSPSLFFHEKREVRLFSSLQSITIIRNNVRTRNDAFNAKTITAYRCNRVGCISSSAEFNQKSDWFNSIIRERYAFVPFCMEKRGKGKGHFFPEPIYRCHIRRANG